MLLMECRTCIKYTKTGVWVQEGGKSMFLGSSGDKEELRGKRMDFFSFFFLVNVCFLLIFVMLCVYWTSIFFFVCVCVDFVGLC